MRWGKKLTSTTKSRAPVTSVLRLAMLHSMYLEGKLINDTCTHFQLSRSTISLLKMLALLVKGPSRVKKP